MTCFTFSLADSKYFFNRRPPLAREVSIQNNLYKDYHFSFMLVSRITNLFIGKTFIEQF